MRWQAFLYNGQITDAVFGAEDGVFPAAQTEARIADIAAALGVSAGAITSQEYDDRPTPAVVIPPAPAAPPSPQEIARNAVLAIDLDTLPDPATRAAFKALRDHVIGTPTLDPEGVWAQHKERRAPEPDVAKAPWK